MSRRNAKPIEGEPRIAVLYSLAPASKRLAAEAAARQGVSASLWIDRAIELAARSLGLDDQPENARQ